MNTSAKNGLRRVACISALSGVFVFALYSLRADADSIGSTEMSVPQNSGRPFDHRPFTQAIVHLDLKGAPPRISVYEWLFPLLRKMGVHGVLMEYEDMFPYSQNLALISRADHYSESDIAKINQLADQNFLEVIPLVQTFGHMEFILKHPPFFALRENVTADNTLCPTDERSINLIRDIIAQVQALHPNSNRIHIGGDEAAHIAEDKRCKDRLAAEAEPDHKRAVEKLKLAHIARVAQLARAAGYAEVFAWNDMFEKSLVEDIRASGLGELITPVVWGYKADVTVEGYLPEGLFDRLSQVFPKIFFASAFKGAKSLAENYIDVERYLRTHNSYVKLYRMHSKSLDGRVGGIIVTGWQRYMHHAPLCELLAISIPSLLTDLLYIQDVDISEDLLYKKVQSLLKCPSHMNPTTAPAVIDTFTYLPHKDAYLKVCDFEGKELFKLIMEDLHMLEWKVSRFRYDPEKKAELVDEIQELAKKSLDGRVGGIIVTGWQRYMHHAPLCELLAISIPSLLTDLLYIQDVDISEDLLYKKVQSLLKCPSHMNPTTAPAVIDTFTYLPHKDAYLKVCDFEGKELFKLIMEDLHMLEWKVSRFRYDPEKKAELVDEIQELAKKLQVELLKYYLPSDVNEFLTTKVLALKQLLTE